MEEENKKVILAQNFEPTEEDIKDMEKAMSWVEEQQHLCLRKYFNIKNYKSKILARLPFSFTLFWALARDCDIVPNEENIYVLWRVKKGHAPLPRLMYIKEKENEYIWGIRFPIGYGEKSKKQIYETKKIKIPKEEMKAFEKEFAYEIKELNPRQNEC